MADPLTVLCKATISDQPVHKLDPKGLEVSDWKDCSVLKFGDSSFPRDISTRYKKDSAGNKYDLETLYFCFLQRASNTSDYLQAALANGLSFVSAVDRVQVIQLLTGQRPEGEECEDISLSAQGTATDEARPAKKAKYVVNKEDQEIVRKLLQKQEARQLTDSARVLRGSKLLKFDNILQLATEHIKLAREEYRKFDKGATAAAQPTSTPAPARPQTKKRALNPIIIVSPSSSAMVTMHNVKRFLEEAIYETSASRIAAGQKSTNDLIAVYHRRQVGTLAASAAASAAPTNGANGLAPGEKMVKYSVVDSAEALAKFGADAWDRVVCVMTTGQEWQFRPYKWPEPKELFHHVKGISLSLSNEPPNPKIASWNVTELRLDPSKRHIDKSVVAEFWRVLEQWIAINKPWLAW